MESGRSHRESLLRVGLLPVKNVFGCFTAPETFVAVAVIAGCATRDVDTYHDPATNRVNACVGDEYTFMEPLPSALRREDCRARCVFFGFAPGPIGGAEFRTAVRKTLAGRERCPVTGWNGGP